MKESSPICTPQEAGQLESLYDAFATVGKAMASRSRLVLLELICQSPKNVQELSRMTGLSIASTSQHLQKLSAAGLVVGTRRGKHVTYAMSGEDVVQLLCLFRQVAQRHHAGASNAARALMNLSEAESLTADELNTRMKSGEIVLIDVRPAVEYETRHIPGAISIPLADLDDRIRSLSSEKKQVVAYCSGPYCFTSRRAVERLEASGLQAAVLEGGFQLWDFPASQTNQQ